MTRVILVGANSFIARHVQAIAGQSCDIVPVSHNASLNKTLRSGEVVVNFALDPAYRQEKYDPDLDYDLRAAQVCAGVGALFVMLSTRRVYPASERWGAQEASTAAGDETTYGQNKARTEVAVRELLGDRVAILRCSNIFGFEYPAAGRRTFLAQALTTLRNEGVIALDMALQTRRDFLPVEICARTILACAENSISGTFNIGAGFAIECGDLARWIVEGYGKGEIVIAEDRVRDEFYLNTEKWQSNFGQLIDREGLRRRCIELGQLLK